MLVMLTICTLIGQATQTPSTPHSSSQCPCLLTFYVLSLHRKRGAGLRGRHGRVPLPEAAGICNPAPRSRLVPERHHRGPLRPPKAEILEEEVSLFCWTTAISNLNAFLTGTGSSFTASTQPMAAGGRSGRKKFTAAAVWPPGATSRFTSWPTPTTTKKTGTKTTSRTSTRPGTQQSTTSRAKSRRSSKSPTKWTGRGVNKSRPVPQ